MMCNVHREEFDSLRPSLSLPTRHGVRRTLQQTGIVITFFRCYNTVHPPSSARSTRCGDVGMMMGVEVVWRAGFRMV